MDRAMNRVEAALGRIERAAERAGATRSDGDLARRHEMLRERVGAALAELDTVIGRLER